MLADGSGSQSRFTIISLLRRAHGQDRLEQRNAEVVFGFPMFVWAAGAGRSVTGSWSRRGYQTLDSVASLFDYRHTALITSAVALERLLNHKVGSTKIHRKAMVILKRIMAPEAETELGVDPSGSAFITSTVTGVRLPLEAWADGYRATLAWLLDAYAWAMKANAVTRTGGICGILLIDEIEQKINPALLGGLVERLAHELPESQIVATTLNPVTTLGHDRSELLFLKQSDRGVERSDELSYAAHG